MKISAKINQDDYTHYVVFAGKIASGWCCREDARDDLRENDTIYRAVAFPETPRVWCKALVLHMTIDPNDNANWHGNLAMRSTP